MKPNSEQTKLRNRTEIDMNYAIIDEVDLTKKRKLVKSKAKWIKAGRPLIVTDKKGINNGND